MKLSVSLSEDEVAALDKYAQTAGLASRSAAIQHAIRLLGDPDLEDAYAAAWDEWEASGDAERGKRPHSTDSCMLRGEIRLTDLDRVRGTEANKRPARGHRQQ